MKKTVDPAWSWIQVIMTLLVQQKALDHQETQVCHRTLPWQAVPVCWAVLKVAAWALTPAVNFPYSRLTVPVSASWAKKPLEITRPKKARHCYANLKIGGIIPWIGGANQNRIRIQDRSSRGMNDPVQNQANRH